MTLNTPYNGRFPPFFLRITESTDSCSSITGLQLFHVTAQEYSRETRPSKFSGCARLVKCDGCPGNFKTVVCKAAIVEFGVKIYTTTLRYNSLRTSYPHFSRTPTILASQRCLHLATKEIVNQSPHGFHDFLNFGWGDIVRRRNDDMISIDAIHSPGPRINSNSVRLGQA